ncbi:MAG: competence/damage-inducible protein A [Thermodesulfovibrionales bacterium]
MQGQRIRTAGILIIGNEILSGKVRDTNAYFLVTELRALGVDVRRILVIPDDVKTIGEEAAAFSDSFDFVFTSGGVGPTHDDVTMEGIASGFGVCLVKHPALEDHFRTHYRDRMNDTVLKMADVPEGAEAVEIRPGRFPLVVFRNIFIFPGIPEYLQDKFLAVRDRFRAAPIFLRKIFLNSYESEVAPGLNEVVEKYKDVAFGSYPVLHNPEYMIIVTAESRDREALEKAVREFLAKLPPQIVVRTE